jgi:hypothetical protein
MSEREGIVPDFGLTEEESERLILAYVDGHGSITEQEAADLLNWAAGVRCDSAILGAILHAPVVVSRFDAALGEIEVRLR